MPTSHTFSRSRRLHRWLAVLSLCPLMQAAAQLPGAPVLQNAWASPGVVAAVDASGGGGSGGSVYALAGSWAPGAARFQLSAGVGMQTSSGSSSRFEWGGRAAFPIASLGSGALGIGAFAGVGGGPSSTTDSTRLTTEIPLGAAVGYRHAFGTGHGASIYATPMYVWASGASGSTGVVRVGFGLDVSLSSSFGITAGLETGQSPSPGKAGPTGTLYGVGLSYAFGAR